MAHAVSRNEWKSSRCIKILAEFCKIIVHIVKFAVIVIFDLFNNSLSNLAACLISRLDTLTTAVQKVALRHLGTLRSLPNFAREFNWKNLTLNDSLSHAIPWIRHIYSL